MTLLQSVCCPRHSGRVALIWEEDVAETTAAVSTYGFLMQQAFTVARHLRMMPSLMVPPGQTMALGQRSEGVCLFGLACPELLSGLLGVMAAPAAFVPVDVSQPANVSTSMLRALGISVVLVDVHYLEVVI